MQLEFADRTWKPDEFDEVVDLTRLALRRMGLRAGHRLGALTGNTPLHVFLAAAAKSLGATLVPMHQGIPDTALVAQLRRARVDLAVTDDAEIRKRLNVPAPIVKSNAKAERWEDLEPRQLTEPQVEDDPMAAIIHTSGTTGTPRAIGLRRSAVDAHAKAAIDRLGCTSDDVWLGVLPLSHVGGFALVDRCLRLGSRLVLTPKFNVDEARGLIHSRAVTHASFVPTMLHRLLVTDHGRAPSTIRCLLVGGDRAPEDMVARAFERGWPVHTTYGLTEAASQVATATPDELRERPGTVGRPLDGVTVRIVDDEGQAVPAGTLGQIEVAGPTLGFDLHHPTTGPLRTGDSGRLDADGFLFTAGRREDLIVTGGKNVGVGEVESVLRKHAAVSEACVVGIEDAEWGAAVAAALEIKPGAQVDVAELERHCRQELADHQVPRRFLVLKRLPRTPTGKLDHAMVRRWIERQAPPTQPT